MGVVLCGLPIGEGLDDGRLEGPNEKAPPTNTKAFSRPIPCSAPSKVHQTIYPRNISQLLSRTPSTRSKTTTRFRCLDEIKEQTAATWVELAAKGAMCDRSLPSVRLLPGSSWGEVGFGIWDPDSRGGCYGLGGGSTGDHFRCWEFRPEWPARV